MQQATHRLARRALTTSATAAVLAALVAGVAPQPGQARAQDFTPAAKASAPPHAETWVCTDAKFEAGRFPIELSLQDGLLTEQPLGVPRYRLLANTPYAIIAEDHFADFDPVLGTVSIFVSAIMIDRSNGSFTATMTLADGAPHQRTGRCRRFETQARAGNGMLARQ
jgi:hypothetical protein